MNQGNRPLDPRYFPNLPPRNTDPFTGEPLVRDDGPANPVQASIGNKVDLIAGNFSNVPAVVAQYDSGGVPCTVTVTCDARTTNFLQWGQNGVIWTIDWGIGGAFFSRSFIADFKTFTVTGAWFRLRAFFSATSAILNTSQCIVSGQIVPTDSDPEMPLTAINVNYAVQDPTTQLFSTTTSGFSSTGADRYILQGSAGPPAVAAPGTVLRVSGVCTATGGSATDTLMAFDAIGFPTVGTKPIRLLGQIVANSTFQFDLENTGQDYLNGLVVAASSTPSTYTRDASAIVNLDHEIRLI